MAKRMSGASGSTVHLSTLINSSTKKNLNHRNGSTKVDSSNHGASSSTLTPQKNAESLNSKLKKKVSYTPSLTLSAIEACARQQCGQLSGDIEQFKQPGQSADHSQPAELSEVKPVTAGDPHARQHRQEKHEVYHDQPKEAQPAGPDATSPKLCIVHGPKWRY